MVATGWYIATDSGDNVFWVVATDSGGNMVVATDNGGNVCWKVATAVVVMYAGWYIRESLYNYRDDAGEISRDPRTKRLKTR